jgi:hypothetical protein
MKFLGVSGVCDYAGLNRNSRYRSRSYCLPRMFTASASGLYIFAARCPTPPILYLRFTASLAVAAQDSRPSGSLLLSCKALSSSTSYRFIPAHKHLYYTHNHWTTAKAFSSEEYFTLYWKEMGSALPALSVPTCFRGLHGRAH